jgi:hypothetical protein
MTKSNLNYNFFFIDMILEKAKCLFVEDMMDKIRRKKKFRL